jgi:hypothetical protein
MEPACVQELTADHRGGELAPYREHPSCHVGDGHRCSCANAYARIRLLPVLVVFGPTSPIVGLEGPEVATVGLEEIEKRRKRSR